MGRIVPFHSWQPLKNDSWQVHCYQHVQLCIMFFRNMCCLLLTPEKRLELINMHVDLLKILNNHTFKQSQEDSETGDLECSVF